MAVPDWTHVSAWLSAAFSDNKMLLEHSIGFNSDALHVFVGVGLQIGLALVLRRTLADWRPWLIILLLELANEGNDLVTEIWPDPAMQLGEGLKDVLLTLAVPTALLILSRWLPGVMTPAISASHERREPED